MVRTSERTGRSRKKKSFSNAGGDSAKYIRIWAGSSGRLSPAARRWTRTTEEFWRRLGYGVIQGYGLTETSSLVSLNHPFKIAGRSIGKVLGGREMKLDPETGEILVRGANVAKQYWQGKELKPVTGEEGWFRTGDLGAVDADGNLYFKGRSKNVIVTPAGLKIYPEDLEQALRQQPEIRDCVVFGVARGGNAEACAALLMRNGGSANTAVSNANQQLADFQKIRCWLEWPDEDFPRTPTQKPKMDMIRRAAEAKLGGVIATEVGADDFVFRYVAGPDCRVRRTQRSLQPGAHLEDDLNLSSLERVELMAALENRYQVELSDRDFSQVTTVGELENLLKKSAPRRRTQREAGSARQGLSLFTMGAALAHYVDSHAGLSPGHAAIHSYYGPSTGDWP